MIEVALGNNRHREIDIDRNIIRVEIIAVVNILVLVLVLALDPQREEDAIGLHHLVMIVEAVGSVDTQKVEAEVDNEKEIVDAENIEVLLYC